MQANNRDSASLWDMMQAIREIQEFTASLSYEDYLESRLVQRGVERNFEILGEAARRLSDDFRTTHSGIDWRRIIGLRNILAHQYELIRQEILWDIVTSLLPPLLNQIETLLPSITDEDN
ncbi:MAG TPA: HepT-like ribonuclease domain-containing protein [Allocoleopsis sp.]